MGRVCAVMVGGERTVMGMLESSTVVAWVVDVRMVGVVDETSVRRSGWHWVHPAVVRP